VNVTTRDLISYRDLICRNAQFATVREVSGQACSLLLPQLLYSSCATGCDKKDNEKTVYMWHCMYAWHCMYTWHGMHDGLVMHLSLRAHSGSACSRCSAGQRATVQALHDSCAATCVTRCMPLIKAEPRGMDWLLQVDCF
jgi:hypothetical protein